MTGVPSIVFGLFIYVTLVVADVGGFVCWLEGLGRPRAADAAGRHPLRRGGAAARARLAARGGSGARHAALAGHPQGRAADGAPGLVTGSLLAVARGAGETAPLLFTVAIVSATTFNLSERMNSLPAQIFNDVGQPNDVLIERAWGAALALVARACCS